MKRSPLHLFSALLCSVLCLVFVQHSQAQGTTTTGANAPSISLAELLPRAQRFEGTIAVTSGGVTTRARFMFQAPDGLRAEIEANDAAQTPAQTYVAQGDRTQSLHSLTGRVRRWNYSSISQPWRSAFLVDGGPANIALFGWPENIERAYAVSTTRRAASTQNAATAAAATMAATTTADDNIVSVLVARETVGKRLVHDFLRAGNSGAGAFYAVYKRPVFDRPARITLQFSPAGALLSREDRDENNRILTRTEFKWSAETRLPLEATTRDGRGRLIETWKYDLAARTIPFSTETFQLGAAASDQIIEDAELRPIAEYQQSTDADAQFSLGVALLRHTEDISAALAAWGEAARSKPKAVAPHFAIFDAALRARDLSLAEQALSRLATLRGANDAAVLTRRLNLELRRRNWDAAASVIETATRAQPNNLDLRLSGANMARARGDYARARGLLLEIVGSTAPQPQIQATAAEALAAMIAGSGTNTPDADDFLRTLPRETVWQRLARAHILLLLGRSADDINLDNVVALSSFAQGQERLGQTEAAIATWQKVIAGVPLIPGAPYAIVASSTLAGDRVALGLLARIHLVHLHAVRGEVTPSLDRYRDLIAVAPDESARRRIQDMLLAAWKKALRGDELRPVLERRAQSLKASEDDVSVWLAWQETFGTAEGIGVVVRSGVSKFPRSAVWHSRLGEYLADQASSLLATQDQARSNMTREALVEIDRAAKIDTAQPFYPMQNALILTQYARRKTGVINATQSLEDEQKARDALDKLAQRWPNDPDVSIAVAAGRSALNIKGDMALATALQNGMRQGTPERETASGDRHTTVFFARQALAAMLTKLGRPDEAARQYDLLFLSSRDAGEQASVAAQYLPLLQSRAVEPKAAVPVVARLMTSMAREPWPLDSLQGALTGFSRVLVTRGVQLNALDSSLALQVSAALRAANTPAAALAAAHLHYALERGAREVLTVPNAPPTAERLARESIALGTASDEALQPITASDDHVLAPRAAALLGERHAARGQWNEAAQWLQRAVAGEPGSLDMRAGLARALNATKQTDKALAVREDLLRGLPRSTEVLRRASTISREAGKNEEAARFAAQALNVAQSTNSVGVGSTEELALIVARALFETGQETRATAIWTGLTSTQWPLVTRLAALGDWQAHLSASTRTAEAERVTQQINAVVKESQASENDVAAAQRYLDTLS
ncbi:MAG TPA: tetratricopeptide repeat protein [Abditibacteriaceae bacterium]